MIQTKHDSARVHGIMFFSYVLLSNSKTILDFFDEKDGVRILFNVISTLKILQPENLASDNDSHAEKTCAKMASICLKRYLERHLLFKSEELDIPTRKYTETSKPNSTFPIYNLSVEVSSNFIYKNFLN